MNRYQVSLGVEGEYEPGSRGLVLRNTVGIARKRLMDQAEADALLRAEERYVRIVTRETKFTSALLRQMHADWLGEIYAWAGTYRTVEVSKNGFTWPPAYLVPQNMQGVESKTLRRLTPSSHFDEGALVLAMAEVQAEVLLVHPFRKGNGRLVRWVTDLMAAECGYPVLDYGFAGKGKQKQAADYLRGVTRGYGGDYLPLADFLREALRRGVLRAGGGNFTPRAPSK